MIFTVAKGAPGARRATASILRQSVVQRRLLSNNKPSLYSAEAAPSQPRAHHDKEQSFPAVADVLARRVKAGKLVAGIAAASDSDMFKGPVSRFHML